MENKGFNTHGMHNTIFTVLDTTKLSKDYIRLLSLFKNVRSNIALYNLLDKMFTLITIRVRYYKPNKANAVMLTLYKTLKETNYDIHN